MRAHWTHEKSWIGFVVGDTVEILLEQDLRGIPGRINGDSQRDIVPLQIRFKCCALVCLAMPGSNNDSDFNKSPRESGDDSEDESEILEESPCNRWLKRREEVSILPPSSTSTHSLLGSPSPTTNVVNLLEQWPDVDFEIAAEKFHQNIPMTCHNSCCFISAFRVDRFYDSVASPCVASHRSLVHSSVWFWYRSNEKFITFIDHLFIV